MNVTKQWSFLPGLVGLWAATIAGCVREYPVDHWIPGVQCAADDHGREICLAERPDRSSTFPLAPECWQNTASMDEPGINAQRMTLIDDGEEIVFAGTHGNNTDASEDTARIAIARFDGGGACPEMTWPEFAKVGHVANGAHVVGPNGRFWSFAGDVGGTQAAWTYDRSSDPDWVRYAVESPPLVATSDLNWTLPNGLAIALRASGVAIVRSVAWNDTNHSNGISTSLERWTFLPDGAPALVAQTQIQPGMGYAAVQSMRGQLRLFPVGGCPPDGLGDRLVALGDPGWAVALPGVDSAAMLISTRSSVDANDHRPNTGSTSVLLPLRPGSSYAPGSVLYIGGAPGNDVDPEDAQLDLFDPACGTWTPSGGHLPRGRSFATPVLLPDGSILLAGDAQGAQDIFYIDPQRGFAVTVGHDTLNRMRGMGIGGLVLADGRVVLAGGNDPAGTEARAFPDVDLWEPPYLHAANAAARPTVAPLSGPIAIDSTFSIELTTGSPAIAEVVLLAYGSSFMGNNPNQRLVELTIDRDASDPASGTMVLHRPPAGWAPAGRYLLFALTADRIPSPGIPVDVVDSPAGP